MCGPKLPAGKSRYGDAPFAIARPGRSKLVNQIPHTNAKSFGDLRQRFNRDLVFSPLDVPDVIPGEIRPFCKLLLSHACFNSFGANFVTESFR